VAAQLVTSEPVGSSVASLGPPFAVLLAILAWLALIGSAIALVRLGRPRRLLR
jgi:hypothetical protein